MLCYWLFSYSVLVLLLFVDILYVSVIYLTYHHHHNYVFHVDYCTSVKNIAVENQMIYLPCEWPVVTVVCEVMIHRRIKLPEEIMRMRVTNSGKLPSRNSGFVTMLQCEKSKYFLYFLGMRKFTVNVMTFFLSLYTVIYKAHF